MVSLSERLTVTVDADVALAEIRALAEEYRQIVADLRELRGKPAVHEELTELGKQAHETAADIATLRRGMHLYNHQGHWQPSEVTAYVSVMNIVVLRLRDALKSSWLVDERAPDSEVLELAQTLAKIATSWRSLETDQAPMDGSPVLLGSFTEDGALVWACAAEWISETPTGLWRHAGERNGWCGLLPHGQRPLDLSEYPPTHWRPI